MSEYSKDKPRLDRQLDRVDKLMSDGRWRTLRQIADACQCSEASASARLRDLRKNALRVSRTEDSKIRGLFHYRVEKPSHIERTAEQLPLLEGVRT